MNKNACFFSLLLLSIPSFSQETQNNEKISFHSQASMVTQIKPKFGAAYSGNNSLSPAKETQTSITATLYAAARLWKGASVVLNPELAGGSGLSGALGVAASTNGETFRVGDPKPQNYLARLYFRQMFSLSDKTEWSGSDANELAGVHPVDYLSIEIGKLSLADFFDDNSYSHDPRTQFLSWGLMDNGAWDYAANTRGYTQGIVAEYVKGKNELRYALAMLPKTANGSEMNTDLGKVSSQHIEYTHYFNDFDAIRILGYYNTANMGDYQISTQDAILNDIIPDVTNSRKIGRKKFGITLNAEKKFNDYLGGFIRAGWNNGKTESWVFTEIDQTLSLGLSADGVKWKRQYDTFGIAGVFSGISSVHRDYLKHGGNGFILGDGNLNYGIEQLMEIYYSYSLQKENLFISGAYQFVNNPGYNCDRGPVNVFSVRVHLFI